MQQQRYFSGVVSKLSGGSGIDFGKILNIIITLLILYILSAIFAFIQGFTMTNVSQKLTYRLRNDLAKKINKLPMRYFDKKTHGEVLSIITNDIDTLSQNLNQSITQIITSICTVIGILAMMLSISVTMTLVSLILIPLASIMVKKIVEKSQKYFVKQQEYLGHVNGQVEEVYGGHTIVKVFNGEKKAIEEFEKANNELYHSAWKSQFLSGLMHPFMRFIGNISYVAVAVLGGYLAANNVITVGNIQSFIQYSRQFTQPVEQIAQVSAMLQAMIAASERVFEFLEEPEEVKENDKESDTNNIKGNVKFDHVKFGYDEDRIIINDFSANIKEGQKIAIVGPTGAGKTTMVKLLMRFYDVNEGSILIDGKNIKDFKRGDLRRVFGMVLQDTWLFSGTVKDNISYGKPDATDNEVIEAAKAAHVHQAHQRFWFSIQLNQVIEGGLLSFLQTLQAIEHPERAWVLEQAHQDIHVLERNTLEPVRQGDDPRLAESHPSNRLHIRQARRPVCRVAFFVVHRQHGPCAPCIQQTILEVAVEGIRLFVELVGVSTEPVRKRQVHQAAVSPRGYLRLAKGAEALFERIR